MNGIKFGTPDTTWKQYGMSENPIIYNGRVSGHKAIIKNEELVAITKQGYVVLPNERALEIATQAASLVGLERFILNRKTNTFFGNKGWKMHAIYTPANREGYRIDGEEVKIGVDVFNSIDRSSSFGCRLFTYRSMCKNGVIMGYSKIAGFTKMHTKSLNPIIATMKTRIVAVMDQANRVVEGYRELARNKLTLELIEKIKRGRIPLNALPDYLQEDELQTTLTDLGSLTEWQVYNDISEAIWHNAKTAINSKIFLFNQLHKAIPVI